MPNRFPSPSIYHRVSPCQVSRNLPRISAPAARWLAALVLCWVAYSPRLSAATLTWDANTGTAGAQDGSGTWDTTTANWFNGTANVIWPNTTDTAVFGAGTVGTYTITLSNTVNVGAITFNQSGYTVSGGGTLSLNPPATKSPNFVVTTSVSGGRDTISTTLAAGTAGTIFTKTGPGTLAISTISGGTAANPTIGIVTGGTYSVSTGAFDSVLAFNFGSTFGTAPTTSAIQFLLDAGTLQLTGGSGTTAIAATRTIKVSSAGGAIIDSGAMFNGQILDNSGSNTSFYISNPSGATTTFANTAIISGPGGLTINGLGTTVFQATNTYNGPTVVARGTLQLNGGSLGNNNLVVAPGATLSLQGGYFRFDLSISSDRLVVPGNLVTGGVNYLRLGTGNLATLTPGAYPLITGTGSVSLAGSYQVDGGASLTVPSTSLIKQFGGTTVAGGTNGGTFYRLTPQPSSNGAQVVITPAPANVINEMPLGSSITEGVSASPAYPGGGYRSQLYQMLVNDGRFSPNFVGSNTVLDNASPSGYNVLIGANQLHHEGHGGYQTAFILNNLNANTPESQNTNGGGFWLASNNGVNPDYVTLSIGGNDYGADGTQTTQPPNRLDAIVSFIEQLRPASNVVVSNLFYRTQTTTNASGQTVLVGDLQNQFYNPLVPGIVFNHVLAGQHASFVDSSAVTPNNSVVNIGADGIHPLISGYQILATAWYNSIAFGSAYWTGAQQDGRWSTVTVGGGTNFAQNYQLTTPYQTALNALTDVYFNGNTAPLATTLGQNLTVRGVNFAAGASGPVTIGGANTLTIGAAPSSTGFEGVGGITVQSGSGAHTISANVVLGGPQSAPVNNKQVWGNVSSNNFTVTGNISGNYGLTLTNSYTIQVPTAGTAAGTDTTASVLTQTGSGTGTFVLSGNNTYTGGTTMSGGTVLVNNTSGSGTGTGPVKVARGGALVNDGSISGRVVVKGAAGGSGTFGDTVTVKNGGTFNGAATINGRLHVDAGGMVAISRGTLTVRHGVVNDGTIRLAHGTSLAVRSAAAAVDSGTASAADGGATFLNNGTLEIVKGAFDAPDGFINHGVVMDSRAVKAQSVSMDGGGVTVSIAAHTGQVYQLQRSDSLEGGISTNVGSPQSGATGTVLTFQDDSPTPAQGFYRVQVDP